MDVKKFLNTLIEVYIYNKGLCNLCFVSIKQEEGESNGLRQSKEGFSQPKKKNWFTTV
jgi:hypothetical protein